MGLSSWLQEEGEVFRGRRSKHCDPTVWGGGHTIQCTEDVSWNCAPETCVILLTSVTPINVIKLKDKGKESKVRAEAVGV